MIGVGWIGGVKFNNYIVDRVVYHERKLLMILEFVSQFPNKNYIIGQKQSLIMKKNS